MSEDPEFNPQPDPPGTEKEGISVPQGTTPSGTSEEEVEVTPYDLSVKGDKDAEEQEGVTVPQGTTPSGAGEEEAEPPDEEAIVMEF